MKKQTEQEQKLKEENKQLKDKLKQVEKLVTENNSTVCCHLPR